MGLPDGLLRREAPALKVQTDRANSQVEAITVPDQLDGTGCAATAADQHNALVMLVRRQGESISNVFFSLALIKLAKWALPRLNKV